MNILFPRLKTFRLDRPVVVIALSAAIATACLFKTPTIAVIFFHDLFRIYIF
nr:MAG TPA: hypothetical protein [Caudoviricetes sp.]